MRYEFIHDSIAQQVFYKAGAEARTRRKVEKYIREHYEQYQERGAELTEDDIDYVSPYLGVINIPEEEARFIREGATRLNRKRFRRRALALGTIAILFAAMVVSLISRNRAVTFALEAEKARKIAELAREAADSARAETAIALERAEALADSLDISLADAQRARASAERARREAERRSNEAQALAMAVQARTIRKDQPIVSLQLAKAAYGKIPAAPIPTVAQTLGSLFYDQFSYRNEAGAPLFESTLRYEAGNLAPVWSPRGNRFLVLTRPNEVSVHRLNGERVTTVVHEDRITAGRWSPDGSRFVTGDVRGAIKVWNTSGVLLWETSIDDWVAELRYSPDGRYLYAWSTIQTLAASPWLALPQDDRLHGWDQEGQPLPATETLPIRLILSLDFFPDGRSILLVGSNGIRVIDLTGNARWKPDGLANGIQQLQYDGRSDRFLLQDNQQRYYVYELGQTEPIRTWDKPDQAVRRVQLSPDGRYALVHSSGNQLELIDLATNTVANRYPGVDVRRFSFSPGGRHVIITTGAAQSLWRNRTDPIRLTDQPQINANPVFSPDEEALVVKTRENRLNLWRAAKPDQVLPLTNVHQKPILAIRFDPTGQWLVSLEQGNRAFLWSRAGRLVSRYDKHSEAIVGMAFSPDGTALLTTDRGGRANLWCVDQTVLAQTFGGNSGGIRAITALPGSEYLLARYNDNSYQIHAPEHGRQRHMLPAGPAPARVALSSDGRRIALQSPTGPIGIWDTSGQQLTTLSGSAGQPVRDLVFTRDSSFLICLRPGGGLTLWQPGRDTTVEISTPPAADRSLRLSPAGDRLLINGGTRRTVLRKDTSSLSSLAAFSPGGSYLVSDGKASPPWLYRLQERGATGPVIGPVALAPSAVQPPGEWIDLWTRDGVLRRRIALGKKAVPQQVSFSPDGARFALRVHPRGVALFDSLGRYPSLLNRALLQPRQLSFSADSRYLLATYGNRNVRVFDTRGKLIVLLNQHQDTVSQASFAPDARTVLTVAGSTAKLFSLRGQLLAEFDRHDGPVRSAHFTSDGRFVLTLDSKGTVRRYPLPGRIYAWLNGEGRLPKISTEERQRYGLAEFDLETEHN